MDEEHACNIFQQYDKDQSGTINFEEFCEIQKDLGLNLSRAKSIEYFRLCDKDGNGEIDFDEFKVSLFVLNQDLNPHAVKPNSILSPKDAFQLFDNDSSGMIDESEFYFLLKFMNLDFDDKTHEKMFQRYDRDGSGFIDFQEFRQVWLRLSDPRKELADRGIEIPALATRQQLIRLLDEVLTEEETKEANAIEEAERYREEQAALQEKRKFIDAARERANDELSEALDNGGQVYLFGSGSQNQFSTAVEHSGYNDELLKELWKRKIDQIAMLNCKEHDVDKDHHIQVNTYPLWGKQISEISFTDNLMIALSKRGTVFTHGGNLQWWMEIENDSVLHEDDSNILTGRSRVIRKEETIPTVHALQHLRQCNKQTSSCMPAKTICSDRTDGEDKKTKMKIVLQYYNVYESSQSPSEEIYQIERCINKVDREQLVTSLQLRGRSCGDLRKHEMLELLYIELMKESRVLGEAEYLKLKSLDHEFFSLKSKKKLNQAKRRKNDFTLKRQIVHKDALSGRNTKDEDSKVEADQQLCHVAKSDEDEGGWLSVAAGANHVGLLHYNGSLHMYGMNASHQLGLNDNTSILYKAEKIDVDGHEIQRVSCGHSHSAAITKKGEVYVWGRHLLDYLDCISIPTKLHSIETVVEEVSCGSSHTAFVDINGHLFVFGSNGGYRLGVGDALDRSNPVRVLNLTSEQIKKVSCGNFTTMVSTIIKHEVNTNDSGIVEENYSGGDCYIAGRVAGKTFKKFEKVKRFVAGDEEISSNELQIELVSCGFSHQGVLTREGEVYCWGDNTNGCCGLSPKKSQNPIISLPTRVNCYMKPIDLSLGKRSRGSSSSYCKEPFHEIDLECLSSVSKIVVENIRENHNNPARSNRDLYIWMMISDQKFPPTLDEGSLDESLGMSKEKKRFSMNQRTIVWNLPKTSVGCHVRFQLEGTNLLEFQSIQIYGREGIEKQNITPISFVACGKKATAVVTSTNDNEHELLCSFNRAVSADGKNKLFLEDYTIYREIASLVRVEQGKECPLCFAGLKCQLCLLRMKFKQELGGHDSIDLDEIAKLLLN